MLSLFQLLRRLSEKFKCKKERYLYGKQYRKEAMLNQHEKTAQKFSKEVKSDNICYRKVESAITVKSYILIVKQKLLRILGAPIIFSLTVHIIIF